MKTQFKIVKLLIALGVVTAFFLNDVKAASVFPIATNPGREYGISFAFDGTNYLVGIWGDEIADTNITAQLVSPNGVLVGPRIKVGRTGSFPYVAFDGTNYLLVWTDDASDPYTDIHGQLINRFGGLVGSAFAITSPGYRSLNFPRPVVFGAGEYLVVWRDSRSGTYAVYGQFISTTGALVGSEMAISADTLAAQSVSAAFDGTNYLAVWQKQRNGAQYQFDTYGVFITPSGTKGTPFIISQTTSANPERTSTYALFNGTNYFVTWSKDVGPGSPSPSDFDISGRLVSPAGSFLGDEIALVTGTGNQMFPRLAFDGASYLLAWSESLTSLDSNVKFQFVNPAGQAIGSPFVAFAAQGTNKPAFAEALFDGSRFAVIVTLTGGDPSVKYGTSADVYGTFIPKSTEPPRLNLAGPLAGAQFPLLLTGTPGINYAVQTSTNLALTNWTALVTISPTNGTFTFTDIHATNASRFYRALKQ